MALAILPGSLATPSCMAAKRAVESPSRKRSANFGAIFHIIGLQCPRTLILRELSLLSFFCPEVSFLWPASVSLSGILTCCRANYCWKCSLYTYNFCSLEKAATHWVRAGAMLSHVRPQCGDGIELLFWLSTEICGCYLQERHLPYKISNANWLLSIV